MEVILDKEIGWKKLDENKLMLLITNMVFLETLGETEDGPEP